MAESCCLCLVPISEKKGKNRQKKLHGASCSEERNKLLELLTKFAGVAICDVPAIASLDSIVCYECCQKLNKIIKFEKQLKLLEDELLALLEQLPRAASKRPNSVPQCSRPAKVPRKAESIRKSSNSSDTYVSDFS